MPDPANGSAEVAEFQGLYGTYHVSELLLQKIWLRGAFDQTRARTASGEPVIVLHPGTWNRLSGPDFRGARVRIGQTELTGDVEVHFHSAAWHHHGHGDDPAYANVVLHVVLFPPSPATAPALNREGREIPELVLVDLLWHDLEEYAADEAVAALSSRDAMPLVEHLLAMEAPLRCDAIRGAASTRWNEKVRYARLRIARCGWEEACHLSALETLGYRANREGMLRVGTRFPLSEWSAGDAAPSLDALLMAGAECWTCRGVRPANQPRLRLAQYARWIEHARDWPERLRAWPMPVLPAPMSDEPILRRRKRAELGRLRDALFREITGEQLGGQRFDTFVINVCLPFMAANRPDSDAATAEALWRLWPPGDIAEVLLDAARRLATPGAREVRTNETTQGLLGLHLQRMGGTTPG